VRDADPDLIGRLQCERPQARSEPRSRLTPRSTVDAIMYCVRERGPQALYERDNIERLSRCDDAAIAEIDAHIRKQSRPSVHPELAAVLKKTRGEAGNAAQPNPNAFNDAWPTIDEAAFHGLAGDTVSTIDPHTEADPVAILIQLLAYVGNIFGRDPHYRIEGDYHRGNIFAVLVGDSSKSRKGTSAGRVRSVMKYADEKWSEKRIKNGLSSGEGVIYEVRDESKVFNPKTEEIETVDRGASDKRLLIAEPEFAQALAVMDRPGNTLSPVIRMAWDGLSLSTLTKHSPLTATGAHISIVGHITTPELRARLNRTDMANGFANRFLFLCVRRSKLLPHGGSIDDDEIKLLGQRVSLAVDHARTVGRVTMTSAASEAWELAYNDLSADRPGLLGAVTARAEAQVIRLALLYALLDRRHEIDVAHLRAALAVWEYSEASAVRIFGNALGDPIADEIFLALKQAGDNGLTRTEIRDLFGRHQSASRIGAALALLATKGRARRTVITTTGRPVETWFTVDMT
jgi:hypothetical protein